ncbi:CrcB family protein [Trueperella sp. LYQ143]|uniref:CrcB family protein n=1 Tax=unclassified Trueperella TaxID=2630174 RepID=UPI003982FA77
MVRPSSSSPNTAPQSQKHDNSGPESRPLHQDLGGLLAVGCGAACGGAIRLCLSNWWETPHAVLMCNLVGCFLLGILVPVLGATSYPRRLLCTGLLGTLTTYSTLALLSVNHQGGWGYLIATLLGGALAVMLGLLLGCEIAYRKVGSRHDS